MNILARRLRLLFFTLFALCILAPSAKADTACAAGSLSTLIGTTCDIGSLQFTFTAFEGGDPAVADWTASNFTLTPVAGGFTVSFNGGPQTFTAAFNPYYAILFYNVTDLDGDLTSSSVSGTATETGTSNYPEDFDEAAILNSVEGYDGNRLYDGTGYRAGVPTTVAVNTGPFAAGYAEFYIFNLTIYDGSAYWGGSSTANLDTEATPAATPEPSSLALLGSGALLLGAEVRRRYRTIR